MDRQWNIASLKGLRFEICFSDLFIFSAKGKLLPEIKNGFVPFGCLWIYFDNVTQYRVEKFAGNATTI